MALKTKPSPPGQLTLIAIAQQWHKLLKAIEFELQGSGLSNILYVDLEDGDNATAERGSLAFKFQTIAAAIAVAQSGDTILLSPGTYTEDVVMPGTLENVTLQGSGNQVTIITNATAVATVRSVPTADTVRNVTFKDLTIQNTSNLAALLVNGAADLNLGNGGRVAVHNVVLSTTGALALDVDVCGDMEFFNFQTEQNLAFNQVGRVLGSNFRSSDIAVDNDPGGDVPAAGFVGPVLTDAIIDDVTVLNLGTFSAASDVQLNNLTGVLTDEAAPVGGRSVGAIIVWGAILGDVGVTFNIDDLADQIPLILDGAKISGTFAFGAGVAGSNLATCRALGAKFYNVAADSITADSQSVVDLRGAQFAQVSLQSLNSTAEAGGTFDRTHWMQEIDAGTDVVGSTITFANAGGNVPFPAGTIDYSVYAECASQADDVGGWAFASKVAASVDVTGTNGAGAVSTGIVRLLVVRPYD